MRAADEVGGKTSAWLWGCLVLLIAVRFAQPFLDGDLFWHMAYARQMLARGTLIPDHTAFSWTPTANTMIYCAWASELWFYWLWQHLGPWSLFALRYVIVGLSVGLAAHYARRAGFGRSVFVPVLMLLMVLMSYVGTIIKPELFSFVFLNALVGTYFHAKLTRATGGEPAASFYVVPAIVAVWTNSHGAFILIAPFLLVTAAGESLNAIGSRQLAFSRRSLTHLLAAWTLCAIAVTLTPYGLRYPLQLFDEYGLGVTPRPDAAWNAAHQGVFTATSVGLHFSEFLIVLLSVLAVLTVQLARQRAAGARLDWAVTLVNVCYVALYVPLLRMTYLWPVIGTYSALYLAFLVSCYEARRAPAVMAFRRVIGGEGMWASIAIGVVLFFSGRAVVEARYRPDDRAWLGFGIADMNPVAEAEFVAAAHLGPRLYNLFDSGGYLLWRLGPADTVMVDQRSFPYLSWFDEQQRFSRGEIFDEFLRKYPSDVAVIDLTRAPVLRGFLAAPGWRLVYFGPSAAVFTRGTQAIPAEALRVAPDRFSRLRNPETAARVFQFAILVEDFPVAWQALDQIERRHRWSLESSVLRNFEAYRDAHRALRDGRYQEVEPLLAAARRSSGLSRHDQQILDLLRQLNAAAADKASVDADIVRQLRALVTIE